MSNANDLMPNLAGFQNNVFVRDLMAGTTGLISVNAAGTAPGNGGSDSPSISADGQLVAFTSRASDLVPNDTNVQTDIFVGPAFFFETPIQPAPTDVVPSLQPQSDGSTTLSIIWVHPGIVGGGVAFNVYRSEQSGGEGSDRRTNTVEHQLNSDRGLQPGHTYYYQVSAVLGAVESARSAEVSVTIHVPAPQTVVATAQVQADGSQDIHIQWAYPAVLGGPVQFNVYRSTTQGGEGKTPRDRGVGSRELFDYGVAAGKTYYYQVAAVQNGIESARSPEVQATAPPVEPYIVNAVPVPRVSGIRLSWTYQYSPDSAVTFNVYRSALHRYFGQKPYWTGKDLSVGFRQPNVLIDSALTPGVTYYYVVTTVLNGAESVHSDEVSATAPRRSAQRPYVGGFGASAP